jgi:hypothetical protein
MAQARVAVGAILSTVTDTANAFSGVVNTISGTLEMANNFVRHNQAKQRLDYADDLDDYEERRAEELAVSTAERKKKIGELITDPIVAEYYNEAYAAILARRAARKQPA